MERECARLGVDVKLNHPATEENLAGKSYDKVILAAGSTPAQPPIPGIENALGVVDYLAHKAEAGKRVFVIEGGLAGTEAAVDIASKADEVTIVEMLPDILLAAADCLKHPHATTRCCHQHAFAGFATICDKQSRQQ